MTPAENKCQQFLAEFEARVIPAETAAMKAAWNAALDASDENTQRSAECTAAWRMLFSMSNQATYDAFIGFQKSGEITDPALRRMLDILILAFKGNLLPADIIKEISNREAEINQVFDQFRPELRGKSVTDNDISNILEKESDVALRKDAWLASKQVGMAIAPRLRELVALRNRAANMLGFKNHFEMAYALEELDPQEVIGTFLELERRSAGVYNALRGEIDAGLSGRFGAAVAELGSWAWSDPFAQENPLISDLNPDALLASANVIEATARFYKSIGIDLDAVLARSDLFERELKNPHASCWDIDREGDVRILANVRPDLRWYTTMMHECGHAAYNLLIQRSLPWFLRSQAHILTTEFSAIFFEQASQQVSLLKKLFGFKEDVDGLLRRIEEGVREHRLIFSRWAVVMTLFEKGMYENPNQDLQKLWWDLVRKYQGIEMPAGRESAADYAAKTHISSAPCYYQNYLLADTLVAQLGNWLARETGTSEVFGNERIGALLKEKFYGPGNLYHWKELVVHACGKPFDIDDWVNEVAK